MATDLVAAMRNGKPSKASIRTFYARLGRASEHGRSCAQAYNDVGARVRAAERERLLALKRRTVRLWTDPPPPMRPEKEELEAQYLGLLPALRASLEGPDAPRVPAEGTRSGGPTAAIVILSYNRLDYLKTTLAAVHQTVAFDDYEIIVVDNGSRDGSAEFLRQAAERGLCSKVILRRKNHGIGPGYNIGFAHARPGTDLYVKLDSDMMTLSPGWLGRFADIFARHQNIGVLALNIVNHSVVPTLAEERVGGQTFLDMHAWVAGGGGMTIAGRVFRELGYFREDFEIQYMPDDVDYHARIIRAGYDGYYVKDLHAFHRTDLDETRFDEYCAWKASARTEFQRALQSIGREYDQRNRPLRTIYSRYEGCVFPRGTRLIELE